MVYMRLRKMARLAFFPVSLRLSNSKENEAETSEVFII